MKISKEDILHTADLAKISLDESEIHKYQNHLEKVWEYFNELKAAETDSVKLFLNPVREIQDFYTQESSCRVDEIKESLEKKLILQNAPDHQYGQFKLASVIKSE